MSDDSDIDDFTHERLLKNISSGKKLKNNLRKTPVKVSSDDLLGTLKSVKRATTDAKKALIGEKEDVKKVGANKTIAPPIHRQQHEKIQGAVGFHELKKDLKVWHDIVESNRLQEQLVFPLHQERILTVDSAAEKTDGFIPKTDMEKEMASILNSSKHNLKNDTVYTEAELEIIKAMDLKEAKQKLAEMQKMRALVSYKEAKYRYAKKIKSKGYHRILKREKRKQLVKEFDELLVRNPEAAKEKLEELETMRILERGSLRHHARSKFQQTIMKHAGKDPAAKKVLEEHLRLGRELKGKAGLESDSETDEKDGETTKPVSIGDIIKSAALAAAVEDDEKEAGPSFNDAESRQHLFEMRANKRAEILKSKMKKDGTVGVAREKIFEEEDGWTVVTNDDSSQPQETEKSPDPSKKKKKKVNKRKVVAEISTKSIDDIFNEAEGKLIEKYKNEAENIRKDELRQEEPIKKKKKLVPKAKQAPTKPEDLDVDISLDPKHYLQVETSNLVKVSADLVDKMDEFDDDQERLIAEAFKDDDVIGEFEKEKESIEEKEKPKDIDLTLQGWGSWVGPGMSESKRRKQFVIKAKEKKRKDQGKSGVIISEVDNSNIEKLQPRSLPFPYTRVEDFQTVMMQPIGKDWNPVSVSRNLCKPTVLTQGGRSIRPMDKKETIKKTVYEEDDE